MEQNDKINITELGVTSKEVIGLVKLFLTKIEVMKPRERKAMTAYIEKLTETKSD